ncbi:hypothetical protein P8631_06940 [Guyparkeria sp. 1SP6A2]|nr:hypothetical protein [Guyparkeria sp. 1SP6A2]
MSSASLRLRHRAAVLDGKVHVRPSPEDELALAKSRLQVSGFMLEERVDRVWLPVKYGLEQRPFLTLAGVAVIGAAFGWLDDRTGNGVQRLFLHWLPRLMPWMTRSMLSRRVPHER